MWRNRRGQIDNPPKVTLEEEEVEVKTEKIKEDLEDEIPIYIEDCFVFPEWEERDEVPFEDPLEPGPCQTSQDERKETEMRFGSKTEFTIEMQEEVGLVVHECVHVLKRDPREYHPFYLTVQKWIEIGRKLDYIPYSRVDLVWEKCDDFAVSQFEKVKIAPGMKVNKVYSSYLEYILNSKRKEGDLSRSTRMVDREWKKMVEEGCHSLEDIRCNVKARLEFFYRSKTLTSLEHCVQMNFLWSQLLSTKLVHQSTSSPSKSTNTPGKDKNIGGPTSGKDKDQMLGKKLQGANNMQQYRQMKRKNETEGHQISVDEEILARRLKNAEYVRKYRETKRKMGTGEHPIPEDKEDNKDSDKLVEVNEKTRKLLTKRLQNRDRMRKCRERKRKIATGEHQIPEDKEDNKDSDKLVEVDEKTRQMLAKRLQNRDRMRKCRDIKRKIDTGELQIPEDEEDNKDSDKLVEVDEKIRQMLAKRLQSRDRMRRYREMKRKTATGEHQIAEDKEDNKDSDKLVEVDEKTRKIMAKRLQSRDRQRKYRDMKRKIATGELQFPEDEEDNKDSEKLVEVDEKTRQMLAKRLKNAEYVRKYRERKRKMGTEQEVNANDVLSQEGDSKNRLCFNRILRKGYQRQYRQRMYKRVNGEVTKPQVSQNTEKEFNYATDFLLYTEEELEKNEQIQVFRTQLKQEEFSLEEKIEIRVKIRELTAGRRERLRQEKEKFMEGLSEEERWRWKMNRYLEHQATLAKTKKRPYSSLSEDYIEYRRQIARKWKENQDRQKMMESRRISTRKLLDKIRQDPVRLARRREMHKRYKREKRLKVCIAAQVTQMKKSLKDKMIQEGTFTVEEFDKQAKIREEKIRSEPYQPRPYKPPKKDTNESEVKVQKRHRPYVSNMKKKYSTPEKRHKFCLKIRICSKKRKLKEEMIKEGTFTVEEFEKRAKALAEKIRSEPYQPRPYKPRKKDTTESEVKVQEPRVHPYVSSMKKKYSTPKKRRKLCLEARIYTKKRKLKEEMIKEGSFTVEEFEKRAKVLAEEIRSEPYQPRAYKPRAPPPTQQKALDANGDNLEVIGESLIGCEHCLGKFSSKEDLRAHVISSHLEMCWTCQICGDLEISRAELDNHLWIEHNEEDEDPQGSIGSCGGSPLFEGEVDNDNFFQGKDVPDPEENQNVMGMMVDENSFPEDKFEKQLEKIDEEIKTQPVITISSEKCGPDTKVIEKGVQEETAGCQDKAEIEDSEMAPEQKFVEGPHSPLESIEPDSPLNKDDKDDINDFEEDEHVPVSNEDATNSKPGDRVEPNKEAILNLAQFKSPMEDCNAVVECEHCSEKIKNKDLEAHIISGHFEKCWVCPICNKFIISPAKLVEHFETKHNNQVHRVKASKRSRGRPKELIKKRQKMLTKTGMRRKRRRKKVER